VNNIIHQINTCLLLLEKKMEIFANLKPINPTWHQVRIPVTSERFSLLYFVEIQKEG